MALLKKKEKDPTLNCPRDQTQMIKITSQGVTIDKCPKCGGIWLDKGEMRRIIENVEAQQEKMARESR